MMVCLLSVCLFGAPLPPEGRPFAERFADPPGSARILKIVHSWPLGAEAERDAVGRLAEQGFGGVATNVGPWDEHYLASAPHWDQLRRVIAEAQARNMTLWLYDEMGYPSGTAGGQVLKDHPEWAAEGLLVATETASAAGPLEVELPPGELVLALAAPPDRLAGARDLSAAVAEGKLRFAAPAAGWRLLAVTRDPIYEGTHASLNVFVHQPYTNLLLPEPTRRFTELTHQRYGRELGNVGAKFAATFTDEPSLMSAFLRPMPYAVLPWADNVEAEFAQRRGYELRPHLAALALADGGAEAKVRYDFWQTIAELVAQNYFGELKSACDALGLPSGGHLLWEEGLRAHVQFYGDAMASARLLGAPSIDMLTSLPGQVSWPVARWMASIAELEGRELVMSETSDHAQRYRPEGDTRPPITVTADQIRGTLGRQMVGGINTFTSYYSFADLDDATLRDLNLYTGRLCTALRGGHQVADVALLYPIQSLWPHTVPSRAVGSPDPASQAIELAYQTALDGVFRGGRDACVIDARALAEARVDGPVLRHGDLAWSVLVLPGVETLPEAAWSTVAEFWRRGGAIVGLSRRPANTELRFPDPLVARLAEDLFGPAGSGARVTAGPAGARGVWLPAGQEVLLPNVLDALLERDVTGPRGSALRATHRRVEGHDLWFVLNDSSEPFRGQVHLSAAGPGQLCDPNTGSITPLADANPHLELGPYRGALLRYPNATPRARRQPDAGPLSLGAVSPLPLAGAPEPGAGEFVRAEPVQPVTEPGGEPAWRLRGGLTKSDTDTFTFAQFKLDGPTDLSRFAGLRLRLGLPAGQTVPASLHAIVHTADGGQYLAGLGRLLNDAGWKTTFLPWEVLARAGWATAGAETLDPSQVVQINIGWGGYLGREGEQPEFSVAAPQVFSAAH